jgi:hypothetical protein
VRDKELKGISFKKYIVMNNDVKAKYSFVPKEILNFKECRVTWGNGRYFPA